jgi:hypothetical protein
MSYFNSIFTVFNCPGLGSNANWAASCIEIAKLFGLLHCNSRNRSMCRTVGRGKRWVQFASDVIGHLQDCRIDEGSITAPVAGS